MPRIDDYNQAFELGLKALEGKNPDLLARYSGSEIHRDKDGRITLSMTYLNREIVSPWPELQFKSSGEALSIQEQVLVVHYLQGAWDNSGAPISGEWISFQDIPDGRFYMDAFLKRAKIPLISIFGNNPERLVDLAEKAYKAEPIEHGDVSMKLMAFPLVWLALIIWKGDEEFPPEGNILFDRNIINLLSAEDISWLAGMAVYPLIGMAKKE
ncbi:MAG: DUF3786 domain-containing protein [Deltaproteobacteria bacterium]|nr:DUF3786 domain-containing protein [Deltaproteobacteria bacterium]